MALQYNATEVKALVDASKNASGQISLAFTRPIVKEWDVKTVVISGQPAVIQTPILTDGIPDPIKVMADSLKIIRGRNAYGEYERLCFNRGSEEFPQWRQIAVDVKAEEGSEPVHTFVLTDEWITPISTAA